MPTIAQYVEKDTNFLKVKGRKKLSDRESALLNAAFVVAEAQLAKLKVKYEKKAGDQRVEQERVKTATIATMAAAKIEGFGKWLTTPYIEYFPHPQTAENVIEGQIVDVSVSEQSTNNEVHAAELVGKNELDRNDRGVADALPGWSKPVVLFIEQTFAKMTPLTTALWFLIVVTAFVALGLAQKTYLESSYDHLGEQNKRLLAANSELNEKLKQFDTFEAQASQDKKVISGLQADIERLKSEVQAADKQLTTRNEEYQQKLVELQTQQQQTIAKYQENTDAATKSQIEALSEAKLRLQNENASKENKISLLAKENESLVRTKEENAGLILRQEKTIRDLNTSAAQQQKQLRSLQHVRGQKNTLVAFSNSVLELVNEVLYERRYLRVNPYERREDFTMGFNKLRKASKETLDNLGIRESM